MESTTGSKTRYIFILGLSIFAAMMLVTTVAYTGLTKANQAMGYLVDIVWQQQNDLTQMQLIFEKTRVKLRNLGLNTDSSIAAKTMEEMENLMGTFQADLDSFKRSINESGVIASFEQEYEITGDMIQIIQAYRNIMLEVMELSLVNDREAMEVIILDEVVLSNAMADKLQILSNMNKDKAYSYASYAQRSNDSFILTLVVCTVAAYILLFFVAVFCFKRSQNNVADMQNVKEIPRVGDRNGHSHDADSLLSEFAKQISELKVVAYDLSRLMKERK